MYSFQQFFFPDKKSRNLKYDWISYKSSVHYMKAHKKV